MKRVRGLNSYLPLLKIGEIRPTKEYLIEEVILENIPVRWQRECDLKGIDESNKWSELQAFLIKCEEDIGNTQAHETDRNPRTQLSSDPRTQTQGTGKCKGKDVDKNKVNNPCKLPDHQGHEWSDCFNN